MQYKALTAALFMAAMVYGQSIVTPIFVHKDGEASASGYAGSNKDLLVDGAAEQVVGWVTFQTEGIDVSQIASATLTLYVKSLDSPGTLGVYHLNSAVTAPESSLPLSSLDIAETPVATVSLGTTEVEKVVRLDITALVTAGTFHGVALASDDGLSATFDAKEGNLPPMVLLTHSIQDAAAKWHIGAGAPSASLGKDGDYYLENTTGDVYAKSGGAWTMKMNLVGPRGPESAQGPKGDKGDKGDQGDSGNQLLG